MTAPERRRGLDAYVGFFETLSRPNLDRLDALTTHDVRFKDPFNNIRGRAALRGVLAHMLENCSGLRFVVTHCAWDGDIAFLRWRFVATIPRLGTWDVTGVSEVTLDDAGRVAAHVDYWDAGEHVYMRVPVIGAALRAIRRRLAPARAA
jgi:limonene-1,2-epoxide hydrolase